MGLIYYFAVWSFRTVSKHFRAKQFCIALTLIAFRWRTGSSAIISTARN